MENSGSQRLLDHLLAFKTSNLAGFQRSINLVLIEVGRDGYYTVLTLVLNSLDGTLFHLFKNYGRDFLRVELIFPIFEFDLIHRLVTLVIRHYFEWPSPTVLLQMIIVEVFSQNSLCIVQHLSHFCPLLCQSDLSYQLLVNILVENH